MSRPAAAKALVGIGVALCVLILGSVERGGAWQFDVSQTGRRYAETAARSADARSPAPSTRGLTPVAFPGAEGFGAQSRGGRGGRVMLVTNLNDSGPGSFRDCAQATVPRICVFRVGGTIETQSMISIKHPYITMAGQTAPGGGVTLKAAPTTLRGPLAIKTHDVVIRHMRFRAGASLEPSSVRRAVTIEGGAHDIILDHVSISWGTDDNLTVIDGVRDVTVQWSIIAEGLSQSTHLDGEHSKGVAISGKQFTSQSLTGRISLHHNLMAHNLDRSTRHAGIGVVDFVNNVVYNWGISAYGTSDRTARARGNVVGNYFRSGTNSKSYEVIHNAVGTGYGAQLYVQGNVGPNRPWDEGPEDAVVAPEARRWLVPYRLLAPAVETTTALRACGHVLGGAGARLPSVDAVDRRLVADVRERTGQVIDDPSEVGGWPVLSSGEPPRDSDRDGMPDEWERQRGLDANSDDSAGDHNGDGYTNVEEYVNELADSFTPDAVTCPAPLP